MNDLNGNKILIVDDDPTAREVLHNVLRKDHYRVELAENGQQALEAIDDNDQPDLILLDIMMPDIDGIEICRRIKNNPHTSDIPIIFVTAVTQPEKEAEGMSIGAVDYISKPVNPQRLRARIRTHLELRHYRRHLEDVVQKRTMELLESRQAIKVKDTELRYLFETMGEILASRDHYTSVHALRVAKISAKIAHRLSYSQEEQDVIELGCLVHDIGKVAIPDDVLLKPGRFDLQDRRIMEFHPLIGARLFAKRFDDDRITYIILQHHERLNGTGYPYGLPEEEIHPFVKIVMVADVYEALIARRPYKHPMSREKAISILRMDAEKGAVLPDIVDTLEELTMEWDPLDIHFDFSGSYMDDLELFRRKTYFREPLSDFYNYRYLLFLEDAKSLGHHSDHYHIIKTDFENLKAFNLRVGYTSADKILDEIGLAFHDLVEKYNNEATAEEKMLMLLRRGADYLIYSETDDAVIETLFEELQAVLAKAADNHELKANIDNRSFESSLPVSKALESLYSSNDA